MKTSASYSGLQKLLHWAVVLTFAFNYIVSDGMGRALRTFSQTGINDSLTAQLHVIVGIATIVLMVLRVIVRLIQGAPELPPAPHPLMDKAAHFAHIALYVAMILTPVVGLLAWFGGVREAGDVHEVLVNLTVLLVIAHVAAALFHQFVLKDDLLKRMSPH
ncbi:cytochrome b [Celeribacter litoreus]|uniref:cytochrome b n=1 Tax=Celeribacter litoreus TaxID=2876714 RepID=UPI001CCE31B2|nr:cytochrome b/b6 domain-containing protein [Celeribacter litoreus]MCA0042785.1 cytochrome b/b6 domain-containing protein [Celeribacter litoreus]